jgi:REP element-mobilizing transposase RayT
MTTGYQINDQEGLYYLTFQVVGWVDIFSRQVYKDIIIANLRYCQQNKDLVVFAYVIMSNHVHLMLQSQNGTISQTIRDFKSYTSKVILETIAERNESRKEWMLNYFEYAAKKHKRNSKYQFWTHENHAVHVYSDNFIGQKVDYIHMNPVRAGIVKEPEDYVYSSASNYASMDSILEVEILTTKWKTV